MFWPIITIGSCIATFYFATRISIILYHTKNWLYIIYLWILALSSIGVSLAIQFHWI